MTEPAEIRRVILSVEFTNTQSADKINMNIGQSAPDFILLAFQDSSRDFILSTWEPLEMLRKEKELSEELRQKIGGKAKYFIAITLGIFIQKNDEEEWPNIIFDTMRIVSEVLNSSCYLSGTLEL